MEMSACMALVGKMNQADADGLIERVDGYISAGMAPQDAQRMAIDDMLAEIQQDRSESESAAREQHADLFVKPPVKPEPYVSKFFAEPTKADAAKESRSLAEDADQQQAWLNDKARAMGYTDIDQLVDSDFDGFMALAEEWREVNPAELMMSRAAQTNTPPGGYKLPEFGITARIIEAIQNRYNRWKQAIAAVTAQGGVLNEFNDFYRAEERYHGKVSSQVEDFDGEMAKFIKDVAKDGVTLKDVQLYSYALHAKERNDYLRTKREANPTTGFDSWSGMTDDDAQAILDDARQSGRDTVLAKHQATLQKWIQGTRDVMLDEGLITDDQYLMLNAAYANYVPLRGKPNASKAKGNGTGSGFNIRGKETEKARGRYSEADNIIEYIIQDRVKALTRAGKNEVLRTFLQFVIDNPDPSLWEINAVEKKPLFTVDDQGNQIIEEANQVVKDDRTVGIKDGGREVFVLIKDEVLRGQMKNMNVEKTNELIGVMLVAQRALGHLYTSLNPVFTVINWARDVQAATMGMIDEVGLKGAVKLWGMIPKAIAESYRAEFGTPSPDYQLFRATGGKTGFMNFRDIEDQAKDLTKRLKDANRMAINPAYFLPAGLDLIEKLNAGIENGTRFAAWQAARSEGKTLAEASSISKNITVNFNRKGTWTPQLSAWFLFFNPAVQGTARIAQSLKDPKVLAVLGAAMGGVAMLALQNASMGEDDDGVSWWDKIPQEVKDRNLIIVLQPGSREGEAVPGSKDGRYYKIPMPYGWNFFATVANQTVDLWRNGVDPAKGVGPAKATKNAVSSFLGAYMPVQEVSRSVQGTSESLVLAAVPDFLNAPAQSILNINSFGRKMYPEDQFNKNLPDSTKMFPAQAGTIFQKAAEGLNAATGGTQFKPGILNGAFDFTPATIEGLARAYGGGPVSFTLDIMNSMYARTSIERPDLDVRRLPFAKQLYGRIDAETERAISFERMDKIDEAVKPVEAARKAGNRELAKAMAKEGGEIYKLGGALETTREKLSRIREQELKIIASSEPDSIRYAKLQAAAAQKEKVLQDLNRAYNAALRSEGKSPP